MHTTVPTEPRPASLTLSLLPQISGSPPTSLPCSQIRISSATVILVITFDEASVSTSPTGVEIFTLLLGSHVKPGYQGSGTYDHRSLLDLSTTALGAKVPNADSTVNRMVEFFQ